MADSEPRLALTCVECGAAAPAGAEGWRGWYMTTGDVQDGAGGEASGLSAFTVE